jgi:hypothetical protein
MPEEARRKWQQKQEEERQGLAAAQAAGVIAAMPLDDLCLAAQALMHGLGHLIVEGQLGEVTPQRATELAVAVTAVLGKGLVPRASSVSVPGNGTSGSSVASSSAAPTAGAVTRRPSRSPRRR